MMIADIHTHILPFIDDGAKSLEESLEMLRVIKASGIDLVIATPHLNLAKDDYQKFIEEREKSFIQVIELVKANNLNIQIELGCELMYTPSLVDYDLNNLTLGKTDYLLIELSTRRSPIMLKETLKNIKAQGYLVVLAHVERYSYLLDDPKLIQELINMGVLFQVNAETVLSDDKENLFNALIKNNLVHLIASDSHDVKRRRPNLDKALDKIKTEYGIDELNKIVYKYDDLINNRLIELDKPGKLKKLFKRYF